MITAVSAVLLLAIFARMMNYELRRDESLYVPPIRLMANQTLYQDFFYNHVPGSAWWFYGLGRLTGLDALLLTGRLAVLVGWLIFAGSIGWVSYHLTRSVLASWCIVILSLLNPLFLAQTGMTATNNLLPLPFAFLGLSLFVFGVKGERPRPLLIALAGFCLSAAVDMKVSAVAFIPTVVLAAFVLPWSAAFSDRLLRGVLPLAAGGLIGGLPILYNLLTEPAQFLAHIVGYHTGPHIAYWTDPAMLEEEVARSMGAKLLLAFDIWLAGSVAVSLSALVALVIIFIRNGSDWDRPRRQWLFASLAVVTATAMSAAILSFLPVPGFPQYFAAPLVCLPLALALLFGGLTHGGRQAAFPAILAATVVVLVACTPRLLQHATKLVSPERWTVTRVHKGGEAIATALSGVKGRVATLSPIYPLEGGLDVYPELATGPFAYRTGDLTEPGLAAFYRMTSPSTVEVLLEADPPAALLLGFDERLEQPLKAFAVRNGYRPERNVIIQDRYGAGVLYVRPSPGS